MFQAFNKLLKLWFVAVCIHRALVCARLALSNEARKLLVRLNFFYFPEF